MATLNGTNLGVVSSEDYTKDAQLFTQPMPVSDSTEAIILDFFGVNGTIEISGTFSSDFVTNLAFLKALVNGEQTRSTYVSDNSGTYYVYIQNVTISYEEGAGQTKLAYKISMIEGANL